MVKGWYGNKQAHSLASKGIKTSSKLYARGKSGFGIGYTEQMNDIFDGIDFNLINRVQFQIDDTHYVDYGSYYSELIVHYNDGTTQTVIIGESDKFDEVQSVLLQAKSEVDAYMMSANGKRRFRKGEFIEVMDDYSFIESHMGRRSNEPVTVKKGDIGQITYTHKDDLEGVHITFKTKDDNVYFDSTDKRFISGKFRKLKMSKQKDKTKINTIFYEEEYE